MNKVKEILLSRTIQCAPEGRDNETFRALRIRRIRMFLLKSLLFLWIPCIFVEQAQGMQFSNLCFNSSLKGRFATVTLNFLSIETTHFFNFPPIECILFYIPAQRITYNFETDCQAKYGGS
jgi:hypothetical protein